MVVRNNKNETIIAISKGKPNDQRTFAMCVSLLQAKETRIFRAIMNKCIDLARGDRPKLRNVFATVSKDAVIVYATDDKVDRRDMRDIVKEKMGKGYKVEESKVIAIDDKIDDLLNVDISDEEMSQDEAQFDELAPYYEEYMNSFLSESVNKVRYYFVPLMGEVLNITFEAKVYKINNGFLVETTHELGENFTETTADYPEKELIMCIKKNGEWVKS